ncbi:hypothetical protein MtrunA17_Chr4g0012231 [Medicago truncatula]|uniref:Uncharacterized protein n=1 Tax=Medicago truncatula TaxID=3880 RepID=A0A396I3K5_MEDTR|nr:hypothetical protein MtrunA17_Chr4g0012231 [Medicago truncatula]
MNQNYMMHLNLIATYNSQSCLALCLMEECSHDEDVYYTRNYSCYFIKLIRINFEVKPIHEY